MPSPVRTYFLSRHTGRCPGRGLMAGQSQHGRKGFLWPLGCTWAVRSRRRRWERQRARPWCYVASLSFCCWTGGPSAPSPVPDWRSLTALRVRCQTGGSSQFCTAALGLQWPEPASCVCVQGSRSESATGPGRPVPGWEIASQAFG